MTASALHIIFKRCIAITVLINTNYSIAKEKSPKFDINWKSIPKAYYLDSAKEITYSYRYNVSKFQKKEEAIKKIKSTHENILYTITSSVDANDAFNYNADKSEWSINLPNHFDSDIKNETYPIPGMHIINGDAYRANNAYGASVNVSKQIINHYTIVDNSATTDTFPDTVIIKMNPKEAESSESHLGILYVFRLIDGFQIPSEVDSVDEFGNWYKSNTSRTLLSRIEGNPYYYNTFTTFPPDLNNPLDLSTYSTYFSGKIIQIWIINKKTGKIFIKIQPKTFTD